MMRAALFASLVLVAGCGFLPEDSFTGKRVGDGIAPWTDLGPVLVCVGSEAMGPPTSKPGGFCSSINVGESACVSDGDCRSRESCVCGRCTVAFCTAASDCAGERRCTFAENRCDVRCAVDYECADGEECSNGTCRGRCFTSADCQTGEVCSSDNYCVTAPCADRDNCQPGESCKVQRVPRLALEPTAMTGAAPQRVVMWLELGDETQPERRRIWRASSRDGRSFRLDPARPVLDDGLDTRAPSVIRAPQGFALYYEWNDGAEIRVATSGDGHTFGSPTLAIKGGAGPAAVRAPSAVRLPDGSVAVYYQIGDGAAIGLATGAIGGALTVRGPVLMPSQVTIRPGAPGAPFWDEVVALRSPTALLTEGPDGPSLRIWFSGFGRESADSFQFGKVEPIPANHSVGYASASVREPDQLVPWPFGPVIDRVDAFLVHREEMAPAVVRIDDDDAYLLYYVEAAPEKDAVGAAGPFQIGRLGVLGNGAHEAVTGP